MDGGKPLKEQNKEQNFEQLLTKHFEGGSSDKKLKVSNPRYGALCKALTCMGALCLPVGVHPARSCLEGAPSDFGHERTNHTQTPDLG